MNTIQQTCNECWGSGWEIQFVQPCKKCNGTGSSILNNTKQNTMESNEKELFTGEANLFDGKINQLSRQIFQSNKKKGFWSEKPNIGEKLMLIVSELSEALEADRVNRYAKRNDFENAIGIEYTEKFKTHIKDSFEDEIADSIIRLLDLCGGLHIDIEFHVKEKLEFNKTRANKHGKKY